MHFGRERGVFASSRVIHNPTSWQPGAVSGVHESERQRELTTQEAELGINHLVVPMASEMQSEVA